VISAERQRNFSGLKSLDDEIGVLGAGGRDLLEILGVGLAGVLLFRDGNTDIAAVFDIVSELFELVLKPGDTDSGRPHIDTAARLTEIERDAKDANLLGNNADGRCRYANHIFHWRSPRPQRLKAARIYQALNPGAGRLPIFQSSAEADSRIKNDLVAQD
jgi:hypothetical protein